ncbi:GDP-fucose synthetase [Sodalis sp. TME1]|nr:GDP-fucose synthetase [Sodalis sp. TME1]
MEQDAKILITGANGVLGHGLRHALQERGYRHLLCPNRQELNALDTQQVDDFFSYHRPHYVFHLASLVFGLLGNMENQLNAIATNTLINQQLFLACQRYPVRKIFFASTVAGYGYPYQSLPLTEPYFFSGAPHAGEYGYAMAKRHALGYLEILRREYDIDYCYGIFTNLFGPYDRFDIHCGHVIPSLIEKAAASVQRQDRCLHVWGRPETSRDFMFSEEAGAAALHAFLHGSGMVNIASGCESTLAQVVAAINLCYQPRLNIVWDADAPIGVAKRSVDISRLRALGYHPTSNLNDAIAQTIDWHRQNRDRIRK